MVPWWQEVHNSHTQSACSLWEWVTYSHRQNHPNWCYLLLDRATRLHVRRIHQQWLSHLITVNIEPLLYVWLQSSFESLFWNLKGLLVANSYQLDLAPLRERLMRLVGNGYFPVSGQEGPCYVCFCSVVVITFALHAKGPQLETGQKQLPMSQLFFITVRSECSGRQCFLTQSISICHCCCSQWVWF